MLLHAALIAVAMRVPWSADLRSRPSTGVVWVASLPRPAVPPAPRPAVPPAASPSNGAAPGAPVQPSRRPEPEPQARPEPHGVAPPGTPVVTTTSPPGTPKHERTPPPSAVDFERERRRVVEALAAEQARERRFSTFSPDDLVEAPRPKDPSPWRDVLHPLFDSHGPSEPSRQVLAAGQARTRFGRALGELCHALTGGFGIGLLGFNVMSACANADSGPDPDSPIRPETLKWLPDCRKVPGPKPSIEEIGLADTGMKCRLKSSAEQEAELEKAAEQPLIIDEQ